VNLTSLLVSLTLQISESDYDIRKIFGSDWSRSWICRSRSGVGVINKRLRPSLMDNGVTCLTSCFSNPSFVHSFSVRDYSAVVLQNQTSKIFANFFYFKILFFCLFSTSDIKISFLRAVVFEIFTFIFLQNHT